uniref:Uncharacterized protein n=1 Tax=viral metagenome TaxID=1070528 RepID=A0A6C0IHH3_9ZZZZ
MVWREKRTEFDQQLNALNQTDVEKTILKPLNEALSKYITNTSDTTAYENVKAYSQKAEDLKVQYVRLNDAILNYIKTEKQGNNLPELLSANGELQKKIQRLSKINDEMKVDVDSAVARDELLRSRETVTSSHTLFLLDRPIRQGMIPYLWVLSILFIGVGLLIIKMIAPPISVGVNAYGQPISFIAMITGLFSNRTTLLALLVSAFIVILFLSLKIGGVFGMDNK